MGSLLRLAFAPLRGVGEVDGAWWPRSRNLDGGLRELFPPLQRRFGLIEWLRLSWADWDSHPDHTWNEVPIGWNRQMLANVLVAHCRHGTAVFLLVIPSEADAQLGRRALGLAADPRWAPRSASEILARSEGRR
ncbi:hypothetical protein GCM10022220_07590 [Actinocatenispora rupis]|uniref:Uncharacterized protein n=1 Tax=Actinocatenispora rupis TaxID=519421 RepID=A0A8J3J6E9_9ACTN|nr:hypothetical protein Aru02nite_11320 [Actinocatenispora rupis]